MCREKARVFRKDSRAQVFLLLRCTQGPGDSGSLCRRPREARGRLLGAGPRPSEGRLPTGLSVPAASDLRHRLRWSGARGFAFLSLRVGPGDTTAGRPQSAQSRCFGPRSLWPRPLCGDRGRGSPWLSGSLSGSAGAWPGRAGATSAGRAGAVSLSQVCLVGPRAADLWPLSADLWPLSAAVLLECRRSAGDFYKVSHRCGFSARPSFVGEKLSASILFLVSQAKKQAQQVFLR